MASIANCNTVANDQMVFQIPSDIPAVSQSNHHFHRMSHDCFEESSHLFSLFPEFPSIFPSFSHDFRDFPMISHDFGTETHGFSQTNRRLAETLLLLVLEILQQLWQPQAPNRAKAMTSWDKPGIQNLGGDPLVMSK